MLQDRLRAQNPIAVPNRRAQRQKRSRIDWDLADEENDLELARVKRALLEDPVRAALKCQRMGWYKIEDEV